MRNALFIHGAWHGPWTWEQWLPLFSERGYAATAVTLRGHDPTRPDYRGVRLADYEADLIREIDRLEAPPILIGHSLGGLLVQRLIATRRFPAAVLLASIPGRYPPSVIARNTMRHPLAMARSSIRGDLKPLVETPELARSTLFTEATPAETVARSHARLTGAWPGLFREMVRTAPPRPLPGTPTLVLAPSHDRNFTVAMQRRLSARLGADFAELEGSGHDAPLDTCWRETARLTLDWLERHAPGREREPSAQTGARA